MIRLLALLLLAIPAAAQTITLNGSLNDTLDTRTLHAGEVVSIRYEMPRAGLALPAGRAQSVMPAAVLRLSATGTYANPSVDPLWWIADTGFAAWFSFGAPAASPTAANAWGGETYAYTYGGLAQAGQDGTYAGAGILEVRSTRPIDPTSVRELRAFTGPGSVTVYLNLQRRVSALADGHWQHSHVVRVTPDSFVSNEASAFRVVYRYAAAHEPLVRRWLGPWTDAGWSMSPEAVELDAPAGPTTVALQAETQGFAVLPPIGGQPDRVYVQHEARSHAFNGVENLSLHTPSECGGQAYVTSRVDSELFLGAYTVAGGPSVGGGPVDLAVWDGATDWTGASGRFRAGSSYPHIDDDWQVIAWPSGIAQARDHGLTLVERVQGGATFTPSEPTARVGWSLRLARRSAFRLVGESVIP
jgi:hypothetical protein